MTLVYYIQHQPKHCTHTDNVITLNVRYIIINALAYDLILSNWISLRSYIEGHFCVLFGMRALPFYVNLFLYTGMHQGCPNKLNRASMMAQQISLYSFSCNTIKLSFYVAAKSHLTIHEQAVFSMGIITIINKVMLL